ncbi:MULTISPECIES: heme-binding domain-containing protein [unclassified Mesorhizobium]|uniref:heme-binding domain-containing protein n=1 Tax=unclassified Mesorhizobium TaxID=325217 RepID=UPI000FCC7472|nr:MULTISPECIES: heme-binding domain-containing protein [unclassified Mesorhizobium]RUW37996.1 heme-binding protein [Mesorhizobium sp. M1E.F.Ca.ET.041.01.1.1]RWB55304.1 MAG: heme-binding protein [Mesorhizobium sp.]RWD88853.1 MAG: heme-binding protein [Mesorhizobium sp.]RWD90646.1 MAG: heme-binding protein [Mesorhizobium sp.]TIV54622.1 MAG: heme-binding protein [Mesorhizobium sp.]
MGKRLLQVIAAIAVVFVAAQLVRPDRTNPPTDVSRTIQAHAGITSELVAVLDRSCGDCHSNATVWPWYSNIVPFSWLMAYGVNEGRKAVNFSEWAGYSPEQQWKLLAESCHDATSGKMPGSYTALRPETRLSYQDIDTICVAAQKAEVDAGHVQ